MQLNRNGINSTNFGDESRINVSLRFIFGKIAADYPELSFWYDKHNNW